MSGYLRLLLLALAFVPVALSALAKEEIAPHMETLFSQHVEFRKIEPIVIHRSFKGLIEQFDPEKLYLLQSEVAPYYKLTPFQVDKVLKGYNESDFFEYEALSQLLERASERARVYREEVAREITLTGPGSARPRESYVSYPKNEEGLRSRLKKQAQGLLFTARGEGLNSAQKERFFRLWEGRFRAREQSYFLGTRTQSAYYMHTLKALAKSLDFHTSFYTSDEANDLKSRLEKEFRGVGIVLREDIEGVFIESVVANAPAGRTGLITPGDQLIAINGLTVADLTYQQVMREMRGQKEGDHLLLALRSKNSQKEAALFEVLLQREKIVMDEDRLQVISHPFENGQIIMLVLHSFYESKSGSCERDIREALSKAAKSSEIKGVILDMRDNSGGFLKQAVKVGGLFTRGGVMVISKYAGGQVRYLRDTEGKPVYNGPLLVLTSKLSASAAEIVAGALQEHGAALIVGDDQTYGKGSIQVQTITDRGAKAFYKVTVGRYYTASGRSTQIHGVPADILLPSPFAGYEIGERYLGYPLTSDAVESSLRTPSSKHAEDGRNWLGREYDFHYDKKSEKLVDFIAYLRAGSLTRQSSDPEYAAYLQALKGQPGLKGRPKMALSQSEFQTREAFAIMEEVLRYKLDDPLR